MFEDSTVVDLALCKFIHRYLVCLQLLHSTMYGSGYVYNVRFWIRKVHNVRFWIRIWYTPWRGPHTLHIFKTCRIFPFMWLERYLDVLFLASSFLFSIRGFVNGWAIILKRFKMIAKRRHKQIQSLVHLTVHRRKYLRSGYVSQTNTSAEFWRCDRQIL